MITENSMNKEKTVWALITTGCVEKLKHLLQKLLFNLFFLTLKKERVAFAPTS